MKLSQESVILIIVGLGIGALIIAKTYPVQQTSAISPMSPVDANGFNAEAAPAYTSYNNINEAIGYNFGPPVINTLPQQTMGLIGAAIGCKGCG